MRKFLITGTCLLLALGFCGCGSIGETVRQFLPQREETEETTDTVKARVYMDEMTGTLMDFDGSNLTIQTDEEETFVFDVTQATLECEDGMITGDEISVIYEGKLEEIGTDTSAVRALKVVDEYHKKVTLEDRSVYGQVTGLTPNTISIRTKSQKTATYPITGTQQYYQNGIQVGTWVYIHFKGKFPPADENAPNVVDASHIKVTSVSDIDPLTPPVTTTPTPAPMEEAAPVEQTFRAVIQNVSNDILQVIPSGSQEVLNISMVGIPGYFPGGLAPGSLVTVTYVGEFNGLTTEGIQVTYLSGQDPAALKTRDITSTVTGTIVGTTANTVTILTNDGATITCETKDATNASTGGLAVGSGICVTFDPNASLGSNLYHCLKITDA